MKIRKQLTFISYRKRQRHLKTGVKFYEIGKQTICRMERHPHIDFLGKCIIAEEFAKPTQEGRHSSMNDTVINLETNYNFTEAERECPRTMLC